MKLSEREKRKLEQRIQLNMDIQENQLFRSQEGRRLSLEREKRRTILFGVALVLLFIVSVLFTCDVLLHGYGLSRVVEQLKQRVNDIVDLCLGNPLSTGIHFVLTQCAASAVVGRGLASAGACYQGLFRNPMASPTMLGVTSGGMLGGTIYLLFFADWSLMTLVTNSYKEMNILYTSMSFLDRYIQPFFIMAGCFVVVIAVMIIAKISGKGKINTVALMLGGTIFTTTINSILSLVAYIMTLTGNAYVLSDTIRGMLAGQFSSTSSPQTLLVMSIPILIPMIILMFMANKLNVIAFGEEEAASMGVNVGRDRLIMIILTTIMTGTTVAFCGQINFVGLMVPQFARFFVGTNYKYLLPTSAFLGGIVMLLAFDLYYTFDFNFSVGTYANVVGSAAFLIFMIRYRRKGHADWT